MHSSQSSRGRVLFEVLCALTIAASCAAAWVQTGASALLGAAGAAALYGLVHLFDMRRPKPVEAVELQRIAFEPEAIDVVVPMIAVEEQPPIARASLEEPASSRAGAGRRKGGSRKGSGRRASPRKDARVTVLAPMEEAEVFEATPPEVADAVEPAPVAEAVLEDYGEPWPQEDVAHSPVAPLFEPEPFVRMPRQAFGRRGRI